MLHAAESALDIEKATEGSLTLVIQSVALTSGLFEENDYLIDFSTMSGKRITMIHQGIQRTRQILLNITYVLIIITTRSLLITLFEFRFSCLVLNHLVFNILHHAVRQKQQRLQRPH